MRTTTADRIEVALRSENRRMADALQDIRTQADFVKLNTTNEGLHKFADIIDRIAKRAIGEDA